MKSNRKIQGRLEREINVVMDGKHIKGVLFIGDLVCEGDNLSNWTCSCSIPGISPEVIKFKGDDALQAFARAFIFASNLIRGSIEDGIDIWWRNKGDKGGL